MRATRSRRLCCRKRRSRRSWHMNRRNCDRGIHKLRSSDQSVQTAATRVMETRASRDSGGGINGPTGDKRGLRRDQTRLVYSDIHRRRSSRKHIYKHWLLINSKHIDRVFQRVYTRRLLSWNYLTTTSSYKQKQNKIQGWKSTELRNSSSRQQMTTTVHWLEIKWDDGHYWESEAWQYIDRQLLQFTRNYVYM